MVLQVAADIAPVGKTADPRLPQRVWITDARPHEDKRRGHRPGAKNDPVGGDRHGIPVADDSHAGGPVAIQHQVLDLVGREQGEVRSRHDLPGQIGVGHAQALAVAYVE